jgi:hypothetical protein
MLSLFGRHSLSGGKTSSPGLIGTLHFNSPKNSWPGVESTTEEPLSDDLPHQGSVNLRTGITNGR